MYRCKRKEKRGIPWSLKWSVFNEALDSCNGLTSEIWWGRKLSMTLAHYWQQSFSVKLGFTDVFILCRDVWNGDRKGDEPRFQPHEGKLCCKWIALVALQVILCTPRVSTRSDHQRGFLVHFPGKCIPPHHLWQNGAFSFFHLFILILKAGPVSGLGLFLQHLLPVLDVLSVWQLFRIACNTESNITIVYRVFIHCQMMLFYTSLHTKF